VSFAHQDPTRSTAQATGEEAQAHGAPPGSKDDAPRSRLRACWLRLDELAQQSREDNRRAEQAMDSNLADHRAALGALVAAGELNPAVAGQVQLAFAEAVNHVWRSNALMTCYIAIPGTFPSAERVVRQADLLAEMAARGDLDPASVAQARAAIERDVAFLALYRERMRSGGGGGQLPPFDQLQIPAEAAEAARFLVDLMSKP
jgi:hypothetical protein